MKPLRDRLMEWAADSEALGTPYDRGKADGIREAVLRYDAHESQVDQAMKLVFVAVALALREGGEAGSGEEAAHTEAPRPPRRALRSGAALAKVGVLLVLLLSALSLPACQGPTALAAGGLLLSAAGLLLCAAVLLGVGRRRGR